MQKSNRHIRDREALAHFVNARASHVTQTALYGYLRTRAGTRFPELFENPDILASINIAKWHIWLACVSDLCVFIGLFVHRSGKLNPEQIAALMSETLTDVLANTDIGPEAGRDFDKARDKLRQRVKSCDWSQERDEDAIFSQSPEALYYWAPIADELKVRDEAIVRNSVRFRWIEVRRSLRRLLDIDSVCEAETAVRQTTTADLG